MPVGGQNLIEALAVGIPVVTGPSMFNFAEATRLATAAGAAVQTQDAASAIATAAALLEDPEKRKAMSEAGKRFCEAHRGAAERQVAACLRVLNA